MSSPLESLIQSASMITTPARTTNSDYFGFGFDSPFATDIKEWDGRIVDVDESTDRPIRRGEPNSSRMDKFLLNKSIQINIFSFICLLPHAIIQIPLDNLFVGCRPFMNWVL